MSSKTGSLLEKNCEQEWVENLLTLIGFNPTLNKIYNGYEIDVFVKIKTLNIGFECGKQYGDNTPEIRNLIHQWDSKNKEIKLDQIVFVIFGCQISNKDRELAKKYMITIWDQKMFVNLYHTASEKTLGAQELVCENIGIPLKTVQELNIGIPLKTVQELKKPIQPLIRAFELILTKLVKKNETPTPYLGWASENTEKGGYCTAAQVIKRETYPICASISNGKLE